MIFQKIGLSTQNRFVINRFIVSRIQSISAVSVFVMLMMLSVIFTPKANANPLLKMEELSCDVMPSKEIVITPDSVQLSSKEKGSNEKPEKTWLINVDGDVSLNGQLLPLSAQQQNSARQYQQQIRADLPWLKSSAETLINENITLLDSAIVEQLGAKSGLRSELQKFVPTVHELLASIISGEGKNMRFSAYAINHIEDRIQELVNQHSGSLIQTAMTEYTTSQLFKPKSQRISLDKLVDILNAKFAGQEKQARATLKSTCQKFASWQTLESQFIK